MKRVLWGGLLWLVIVESCAPAPLPKVGEIVPVAGAKYYQIPNTFRDEDLICEDANQPGTCATVADVRVFLHSRRTE